MKAHDILTDIRDRQKAIADQIDRMETIRASLYGSAIRYDGDKVQISMEDIVGDRLAEACDYAAAIRKRQKRLDRRKADIRRKLQCLGRDPGLAIDLYYLAADDRGRVLSWADVARIMQMSEDYIRCSIAPRAMEKLNNIWYAS